MHILNLITQHTEEIPYTCTNDATPRYMSRQYRFWFRYCFKFTNTVTPQAMEYFIEI